MRFIDMKSGVNFNLQELVGENALKAYETYIKLTEYSSLITDVSSDVMIGNDYNLRNYSYPMGLCVKEAK